MRTLLLLVIGVTLAAPLPAQQPVRWEYATLTLISGGRVTPIWSAGDSTSVLEWAVEHDIIGRDTNPRTIREASSLVRILNAIGEQGWELVQSVPQVGFGVQAPSAP